jgi:hypothetical protein
MKTKETWKQLLFAGIVAVVLFTMYPVIGGTASTSVAVDSMVERSFADQVRVQGAVKETGATITEVEFRVKRDGLRFQNEQEAELFLQAIAQKAGISAWKEEQHSGMRIYRGELTRRKGVQQAVYISLFPSDEKGEMQGGLGLVFRGEEDKVSIIKYMTMDFVQTPVNSSELPQIISCVRGFYNGKLENDLQKKKASQILVSLEGTMVERLEEEKVLSYSAYSPLIDTVIKTNQRSMNLQVAMHYDTYKQGTMITAGIPIITTEY